MSQTWYMSFTFTAPTPPGFDSTIYLAFTTNISAFGFYTVDVWYNIKPPQSCSIDTNSEIYASPEGTFNTNDPQTVNFDSPNFPALTVVGAAGYSNINGIPVLAGSTIILNSAANTLNYSTNGTSSTAYTGTYVFSNNTLACCFSEGTRILGLTAQLKEEYRLVQDLIIGDFIKSYLHGYRKVSKILKGSFINNPTEQGVANCMYIMTKTEDNGLIEDLTLTRNHGVLVEKLTEDEEKKVDKNNLPVIDGLLSIITADSDKFEKVEDTNVYNYYHFSLDGDGDNDRRFGVYANGLLVETPSNNMMDGAMNIKPLDF
jgi:hypothetical protein